MHALQNTCPQIVDDGWFFAQLSKQMGHLSGALLLLCDNCETSRGLYLGALGALDSCFGFERVCGVASETSIAGTESVSRATSNSGGSYRRRRRDGISSVNGLSRNTAPMAELKARRRTFGVECVGPMNESEHKSMVMGSVLTVSCTKIMSSSWES